MGQPLGFYEKQMADNEREESEFQFLIYFLCCISNSLIIFSEEKWVKIENV